MAGTDSEQHFVGFDDLRSGVLPLIVLLGTQTQRFAQTAGAICVHNAGVTDIPQIVFFMGIDNAKFRKPVLPGDTLHLHVKKVRNRGNVWRFRCEAKVNGQTVAEAEISAMIVDPRDAKKA